MQPAVRDPMLQDVMTMLTSLKTKGLEFEASHPSQGVTMITFHGKKQSLGNYEGTSRIRIRKADGDQYRIETDGIDPDTFREVVSCSCEVITGIIEGVLQSYD